MKRSFGRDKTSLTFTIVVPMAIDHCISSRCMCWSLLGDLILIDERSGGGLEFSLF